MTAAAPAYGCRESDPPVPVMSPIGYLGRFVEVPPAEVVSPKRREAQVLFDDRSKRPCVVLGWWHSPRSGIKSGRVWYVHLRLLRDGVEGVSEGWYAYDPRCLKPI